MEEERFAAAFDDPDVILETGTCWTTNSRALSSVYWVMEG